MSDRRLAASSPPPPPVQQPCSEQCVSFRRVSPDGWSEYGRCVDPHSPHGGSPVRTGLDCPFYRARGVTDFTPAN